MNPFQAVAKTVLKSLKRVPEEKQQHTLALVLAQAAMKGQEAFRKRIWTLEMPLKFDRYEVEHLSNSHAYMKIEMAKALGEAILDNDTLCLLSRDQSDKEVKFTAKVALVPKADWVS